MNEYYKGDYLLKKITEKNIIGIDPGTKKMGIAILYNFEEQGKYYAYYYELLKFDKITIMEFLEKIRETIINRINDYKIEEIIIERMFVAYNNRNSALLNLIPRFIKEIVPKYVKFKEIGSKTVKKKLCGSGNATKEQVRKEVNKRLGLKIKDFNISDAFALLL